ncbi:hypothetical protein [Leptodesmis sichuanensis]|nr:hypothetical protein [Leptodesmis sichuanensis]
MQAGTERERQAIVEIKQVQRENGRFPIGETPVLDLDKEGDD